MSNDELQLFAVWMRERRAELGMSKRALAEAAKIARGTVDRIEAAEKSNASTRLAVERVLTTDALRRSLEDEG